MLKENSQCNLMNVLPPLHVDRANKTLSECEATGGMFQMFAEYIQLYIERDIIINLPIRNILYHVTLYLSVYMLFNLFARLFVALSLEKD